MKKVDNINRMNSPIWVIALVFVLVLFISIYFFRLPLEFTSCTDEGDFGRDLYDFWLVSQGKLPYIDFNWIYGPVVPLLYGLIFKLFGVSAFNALVLWYVNFVVSVVLLFYVIKTFSNRFLAFVASLAFMLYYQGFLIMVFNHVTGLIFMLLSILFLYKYYLSNKNNYAYYVAISCFLLMMVKLNIGIAFSLPVFVFLILFNLKKNDSLKPVMYSICAILVLLISFYSFVFVNTPFDHFLKSFPYFTNNHTNFKGSLIVYNMLFYYTFVNSADFFTYTIFHLSTINLWYFLAIIIGCVSSFLIYRQKGIDNIHFKFILTLTFAALMCCHEFILIGSSYSLRQWSLVVIIVLVFYIINYLLTEITLNTISMRAVKVFAALMFLVISVNFYIFVRPYNTETFNCTQQRMGIRVSKFHWYHVMSNITRYIEDNTAPGDRLFATPIVLCIIFYRIDLPLLD